MVEPSTSTLFSISLTIRTTPRDTYLFTLRFRFAPRLSATTINRFELSRPSRPCLFDFASPCGLSTAIRHSSHFRFRSARHSSTRHPAFITSILLIPGCCRTRRFRLASPSLRVDHCRSFAPYTFDNIQTSILLNLDAPASRSIRLAPPSHSRYCSCAPCTFDFAFSPFGPAGRRNLPPRPPFCTWHLPFDFAPQYPRHLFWLSISIHPLRSTLRLTRVSDHLDPPIASHTWSPFSPLISLRAAPVKYRSLFIFRFVPVVRPPHLAFATSRPGFSQQIRIIAWPFIVVSRRRKKRHHQHSAFASHRSPHNRKRIAGDWVQIIVVSFSFMVKSHRLLYLLQSCLCPPFSSPI